MSGLLTDEERKLPVRAVNLMDESLETPEVMQDEELIKDLRTALREVRRG